MILQLNLDPTIEFIIWLIVGTIIVGLFIYLATWLIVSRAKAKDKIIMIFIAAFLGIFLLPIISGAIGYILNAIGSIPALLPWGGNYMELLLLVIEYLLLLIILKFLLNTEWSNAVWISLITLFLLYLLYSFFPILYTFLRFSL